MNICLKKRSLTSKRQILCHHPQQLEHRHSSLLKLRKKKVRMMTPRVMEVTTGAALPENVDACAVYHCKWRNMYFELSQTQ